MRDGKYKYEKRVKKQPPLKVSIVNCLEWEFFEKFIKKKMGWLYFKK